MADSIDSFEPQTIVIFPSPACGGDSPNGKQRSLPEPTEDEVALANVPRHLDGKSATERVMTRISSDEDGERLCIVSKNIQAVKNRLWNGIAHLSEQRWHAECLD